MDSAFAVSSILCQVMSRMHTIRKCKEDVFFGNHLMFLENVDIIDDLFDVSEAIIPLPFGRKELNTLPLICNILHSIPAPFRQSGFE